MPNTKAFSNAEFAGTCDLIALHPALFSLKTQLLFQVILKWIMARFVSCD